LKTPVCRHSFSPLAQNLIVARALPTIPVAASKAVVQVEGSDVRYRADGTDPDVATGMLIPAGSTWVFKRRGIASGAEVHRSDADGQAERRLLLRMRP